MKKVRNLKNILKKRVRPALLAAILLFTMGFSGYAPKASDSTIKGPQTISTSSGNEIEINKTAEPNKDDKDLYTIKFDISGKVPKKEKVKADIIMVVDESASMKDKIGNVKEAAKEFVNQIYDNTNSNEADVRMAISTFGTHVYNDNGKRGFTNDKDSLLNYVNNLTARFGNGTNTEGGMDEVKRLLDKSRDDRKVPGQKDDTKRYVLFFTDGLPTYYYNDSGWLKGTGSTYYDRYFKEAQKKYNEIKGSITTIGGIGYFAFNFITHMYADNNDVGFINQYPYDKNNNFVEGQGQLKVPKGHDNYPEAKMYSVGLFTNPSEADQKMAKQFLSTIQSVASSEEEWASKYYTHDKEKIGDMFRSIAKEISTDINNSLIEKGQITDVLPSTFTLPKDPEKIGLKVKVNGKDVSPNDGFFKVSETKPETIEFDLSKINQNPDNSDNVHIEISYNVELSDPYFAGKDVPTNVEAHLKGYDPLDPNKEINGTFPVPSIPEINPNIVSINVETNLISDEGLFNPTFPISIEKIDSTEKYNVDLANDDSKSIKAYLRGNDTTTYNLDWYEEGIKSDSTNYGYITAGTYKVSEVVPMDYANTKIQYSYDNNTWETLSYNQTFTIDKTHPDIYIYITNEIVNNNGSYWRDRSDVTNTLKYTGNN